MRLLESLGGITTIVAKFYYYQDPTLFPSAAKVLVRSKSVMAAEIPRYFDIGQVRLSLEDLLDELLEAGFGGASVQNHDEDTMISTRVVFKKLPMYTNADVERCLTDLTRGWTWDSEIFLSAPDTLRLKCRIPLITKTK